MPKQSFFYEVCTEENEILVNELSETGGTRSRTIKQKEIALKSVKRRARQVAKKKNVRRDTGSAVKSKSAADCARLKIDHKLFYYVLQDTNDGLPEAVADTTSTVDADLGSRIKKPSRITREIMAAKNNTARRSIPHVRQRPTHETGGDTAAPLVAAQVVTLPVEPVVLDQLAPLGATTFTEALQLEPLIVLPGTRERVCFIKIG